MARLKLTSDREFTERILRSMKNSSPRKKRGIIAKIFFPPIRVRFTIALLLTFFPYGLLYPLMYPAGELVALSCWIWVFPSAIGFSVFALAPLIPTDTYGYWAFNLFTVMACLSIAVAACNSREWAIADWLKMYEVARGCMVVTLFIALAQVITDQGAWMSFFPEMRLEPWRGAGLKYEPSQISSLLAIFLVLLAGKLQFLKADRAGKGSRKRSLREGILILLAALTVTRSITVLLVSFCFVAVLFTIKKKHLLFTTAGGLLCTGAVWALLGERFNEAAKTSGGSLTEFMTSGLSSWRNAPDILILVNPMDFFLPGTPGEVRLRIHNSAVLLSPLLGWLQNTFSQFSASGVTLGLAITGAMFVGGLYLGMKKLPAASFSTKSTWLMAYLVAWWIVAKWDPTLWVAVGMLPLAHRLAADKLSATMLLSETSKSHESAAAA
jgi:hypothetical protein